MATAASECTTVYNSSQQTVGRLVNFEARKLSEGAGINEDQQLALLLHMRETAQKLIAKVHGDTTEKVRQIVKLGLDMPMSDLGEVQQNEIMAAISSEGALRLAEFKEKAKTGNSRPSSRPSSLPPAGFFNASLLKPSSLLEATPTSRPLFPIVNSISPLTKLDIGRGGIKPSQTPDAMDSVDPKVKVEEEPHSP